MRQGCDRPVDDGSGREVAAHGVDGNPDHGVAEGGPGPRLIFVDRARLTPSVVAAVSADTMRRLGLVAVRALAQPGGLEGVVRPPLCRSRLGVASFWIRHLLVP